MALNSGISIPASTSAANARSACLAWATVGLVALMVLPSMLSAYWVKVWLAAVIYTLAASGVSLLFARLGLVSLAQVALTGVGGWVCLRVAHATGAPFEVSMLAGATATAAVGVIVGLPALRMRGLYLALVTLMAAAAFTIVVTSVQFPNGGEGFAGYGFDPRPMHRPALAQSDEALLRYAVLIALLGYGVIAWHLRNAPGRAWAMIRRSEAVAMSAGVDVVFYKCWAFALSGFLAGIAGSLLAATLGTLDARSFPASESILLFALTVVGGAFSPLGQIFSGVLYRVLPALLDTIGVDGNLSFVIFGAALLQALITAPQGLAGQMLDAVARVRHKRRAAIVRKELR